MLCMGGHCQFGSLGVILGMMASGVNVQLCEAMKSAILNLKSRKAEQRHNFRRNPDETATTGTNSMLQQCLEHLDTCETCSPDLANTNSQLPERPGAVMAKAPVQTDGSQARVCQCLRRRHGGGKVQPAGGATASASGLSRGTQCSVTDHTGTGTHYGAGHLLDAGGGARGRPLPQAVNNQDRGEDPESVRVFFGSM
jgi:hypothetical protein